MREKFYDLNGRENCVTARIKIGDKEFKISRVVTGARVLYAGYLNEVSQLLKESEAANKDRDKAKLNEVIEKVNAFADRKKELFDEVLTLLLEKNGYEYDKDWWLKNTDEMDVNAFIEKAMTKDATNSKKKEVQPV